MITFLSGLSVAADAHGQSWTLTVVYEHNAAAARLRAAFASGGLWIHSGWRTKQGCRRCRAKRPGVPADKDHRSGEEPGTARHSRGVFPPSCAIAKVWKPFNRILRMQGKRGLLLAGHGRGDAPVDDRDSVRGSTMPGLTGRSITMDERLCRSVRRPGPNDRCGTVAGGHRHARR